MDVRKMSKEELELLSNKDITFYLLEGSKNSINTADLFREIIKLLELPESDFETKIGDYYTALATDKRFIMLEDGTWDLRSRHTSDKVVKLDENDDDDDEEIPKEDIVEEEIEEDNYDDTDDDEYDDTEEDLKDLVVIDEDELELED